MNTIVRVPKGRLNKQYSASEYLRIRRRILFVKPVCQLLSEERRERVRDEVRYRNATHIGIQLLGTNEQTEGQCDP